jgi:cell division protein FtsA
MIDPLFSLDIGTRTVVGVVSILEDDHYRVLDYEIMSHPERAMYDGQIHDIEKVTQVVCKIKEILEERCGMSFKKVAIAAAGRALKTIKTSVERPLDIGQVISQEIVNNVEMEGVQKAQAEIEGLHQTKAGHYYCVGYNVCHYYIDDVMNINPKDHRGDQLKISLIATFLPHIVVDSLYTVVDRAGLEVQNMTLEPIAAINIAIPSNLRLLNLALVDIGAGTSDIAITKDGTVISFGMVAAAGDLFTEAIAQEFLLSFDAAEALKMNLSKSSTQNFVDVIGIEHSVESAFILERIKGIMIDTAEKIAEQILSYNEKAPSAVFCIGGGGQIPGFTDFLATALGMQNQRVVIKPVESLEKISFDSEPLLGPDFITPLGIGLTALKEKEKDFLQIMVNDKSVRMLNAKTLSVSDALILVGYQARALLPERGKSLKFSLNALEKNMPGGYGEAAEIFVNGKKASLDVALKHKDVIHVNQGKKGEDAKITLEEVLKPFPFIFNDEKLINIYDVKVNGLTENLKYKISQGDLLTFKSFKEVKDIMIYKGLTTNQVQVYANGSQVEKTKVIEPEDIIRTRWLEKKEEAVSEIPFIEPMGTKAWDTDSFKVEMGTSKKIALEESFDYNIIVNEKPIYVKGISRKMVFVDIFDYIDFDISKPRGILVLKLNGHKANYTDFLKDGDVIEIRWK